jgi:Outer membrane receptor proteins, mostly Fe transport
MGTQFVGVLLTLRRGAESRRGTWLRTISYGVLLAAILVPLDGTARAQSVSKEGADPVASETVEDVVVTAERHAQSLEKTPVSVGVISGDDLAEKDVGLVRDLEGKVAGLAINSTFSPSMGYTAIRGIGSTAPTGNSAVGFYVDDVYIPRIVNSGTLGLLDIERIEVLRGPQGTLYGQNSSAGALKIISRDPQHTPEGTISVQGGNDSQFVGKAYATGPIVEDILAASFAYTHQQSDGYVYNATLDEDVNGTLWDQARLKLKYTPKGNDGFKGILSLDYLRDRSDNSVYVPFDIAGARPYTTYDSHSTTIDSKSGGVSFNLTQALNDALSVKSITAVRHLVNARDPWSYGGKPGDINGWETNVNERSLSQEFQLQGDYKNFNFTAGVIGFKDDLVVDRPAYSTNAGGVVSYNGVKSHTTVNSWGVYGQSHVNLTEALGLTTGLRYSMQSDDYSNYRYNGRSADQATSIVWATGDKGHDQVSITPKIGLDYKVTPDLLTYVNVSKGTKAGTFNPVATSLTQTDWIYPEKVTAYELGAKFSSFGGKVKTNVAVFYNDFKNYQTSVSGATVGAGSGSLMFNVPEAHTQGVELEVTTKPIPSLLWRFNATVLKAVFDDFSYQTPSGVVDRSGNSMRYASDFSFGTSAAYTIPIETWGGVLRISGDLSYASKSYSDDANASPIEAHLLANAGIFYTFEDRNWTVSLTAKNIFGETYALNGEAAAPSGTGAGTYWSSTYNPPRSFLLGTKYEF